MTQTNDLQPPPGRTETPAARNGAGNLSDRVRSLRLSEQAQSGRGSRSTLIPWTLCTLLLLMTAGFAYRAYMVTPAPATNSETVNPTTPRESSPTTSAASSGDLALELKGLVTPIHQIQVSPKVSGQLVWLNPKFEEGAYFKEGTVLARIEAIEYKSDYEKAKATLEAANQRYEELKNGNRVQEIVQSKADLDEQKANLEQLRLELKRTAQLATRDAAASRDYEVAKYAFDAMERRVARLKAGYELMEEGARIERKLIAQAEIDQAKADLAKAEWRLKNTEIVAPASGTILTKKAELGNLVNPSAFSNGLSASLCDMADLTELEIEVKVQERERPNVFLKQRCDIMPEAFRRDEEFIKKYPRGYSGEVSRIMPTADSSQSAIPVRVRVSIPPDEAGVYLSPNMGATVTFKKKSQ